MILKTFDVKADKPTNAEVIEVKIPAMMARNKILITLFMNSPGQVGDKLFVEYMALEGPLESRPGSHRELLAVDVSKPKDI